jgi:glycosyltransferase involved in cell wall biosynthesis
MSLPSIHKSSAGQALPQKATVTVVIPAFNAAAFLGEALESVLAQTYQPLEVIVVDDSSEDETPKVVAAYAGKVTYMRKPHGGGCGGTRNVGIRAASGEWIAFLDADDAWMPDLLEKEVEVAAKTGADLVFCDWREWINGRLVGPSHLENTGLKVRLESLAPDGILLNPFETFLEVRNYVLPSTVLVKRNALVEIGLFDESIYCTDDLDLWLRLSLRYRFGVVAETLMLRRMHADNMSNDTWTMLTNEIKTYEKVERYAPKVASGTRWRKLLRKRMGPMLREQGSGYMGRGKLLLARETWAKCFWRSHSPVYAVYWLLTFLPKSWVECLRDWKNQLFPPVFPSPATPPDRDLK